RSTLLLGKLAVDLETGLRGYVLTGNNRFLEPWRSARDAMPYAVRHLQQLVANDPAQQKRVRELVAPIDEYLHDYSIPMAKIARISPSAARSPGATRLADGDLSTRLHEEGLGEIYELTRAFNSMAVALEQGKREL